MKNIFAIFHRKNTSQKPQPGFVKYSSRIGNDAFTDWTIIMVVACLLAAVLIGIGGYVYVSTQAELALQGTVLPTSSAASHFDVNKLTGIINTFDARASERVMLSKGFIAPKDPSLP